MKITNRILLKTGGLFFWGHNTKVKKNLSSIPAFLILVLLLPINTVNAQQMVVDDADITTYRSFQMEAWYGSIDSWVLPAIGPLPFLEITTGAGFNSKGYFNHGSWLFEGKFAPEFLRKNGNAVSLVSGVTINEELSVNSYYIYVPYTREILDNSSLFHANVGFQHANDNDSWENEIFYGIRGDIMITERFFLLAEAFSSNLDLPGFQAGLRIVLIEDLLETDITWGKGLEKGVDEPGFNFGLAFTPTTLW